jgi:[acyl-carrier-protein] S-malonyltransferase
MGRDLAKTWAAARRVYDRAARVVGRERAELSFGGASRRSLMATDRAHLAVFLHSMAAAAVLGDEGIEPAMTAGHSLGQLAAVTVAGALDLEAAVWLVERRGALLAEVCRRRPGGMLAVRAAVEEVERVLAREEVRGVTVANVNGPAETAVSGGRGALRDALRALRAARLPASPLAVDGAFHSAAMAPAEQEFRRQVAAVPWRDPGRPVVSTRDGRRLLHASEVRSELTGHIVRPVAWDRALETLAAAGVDRWVEVGPGRALSGLVARRDRGSSRYVTSRSRQLAATCRALAPAARVATSMEAGV